MLSALIGGHLDLVLGDGLALWNFLNTPQGAAFTWVGNPVYVDEGIGVVPRPETRPAATGSTGDRQGPEERNLSASSPLLPVQHLLNWDLLIASFYRRHLDRSHSAG